MRTIHECVTHQTINEDAAYDEIIKHLENAKENGMPLNEGVFGSLFGGMAGMTVGPMIMKAVASCLGIDLKGPLGNLMTSKLVLTSVGAKLGWRM